MTQEFLMLLKLLNERKVFLSFSKNRNPFEFYLLWKAGRLSPLNKGSLIYIIIYYFYFIITFTLLWIILAIILAIFVEKFLLLIILLPIFVLIISRRIGYLLISYKILDNEDLFETLWTAQVIYGIISTEKSEDKIADNLSIKKPKTSLYSLNKNWKDHIEDFYN